MNDIRNRISLLAAQGAISKEMREILYALCKEIESIHEGLAAVVLATPERVPGDLPLFVEPEDTGDGVRGIEDPNRENSLDIEQPSLARPSLRDA
jgi:hypothetical protein